MAINYEELYADRIGGKDFGKDTKIYKFEKIKRARKAFEDAHPKGTPGYIPVINVGVGEHDGLEPRGVSAVISREVRKKRNKGYPDNGIIELQQAAVRYVNRTLGTNIPEDDGKEGAANWAIHCIGSKNFLALLPLSFINPGNTTLMTTPGYPVLGTWTGYLGGNVAKIPLEEKNGFLPDLNLVEDTIVNLRADGKKVKLFCINYPNNPTGADAPLKLLDDISGLAHKYNFVVVQDAAYTGWAYGGRKQTGILQAKGGPECGIMAYSMSKAFNMIGRRIGIAVGNPKLIAAHAHIKDNSDSGQDSAIQRAAAYALDHPRFTQQIAAKYERRLGRLVDILGSHGFSSKMPEGSFFLYTRAPTGIKNGRTFANAEEATKYMLEEHGVSTVPWDDVGHYLRFSATFDAGKGENILSGDRKADEAVYAELDKRLGKMQLRFD